jgi:signal-transduction protein with cAMP-binding, CBS, and nucleotidyltransferase domain
MRLSDVLHSKAARVVSLPPNASVAEAASLMKREGVGAVVIRDDEQGLLGLVCERDLVLAIAAFGRQLFDRQVGSLMALDVPTASRADPIQDVMRTMTERRARHLPVVENGRVIGVVSIGDVMKSRLSEKIQENAVLQDLARFRAPL